MHPGLTTLRSGLPIVPGIHSHSVIAVKDGIPSTTANDAVAEYPSACQANPPDSPGAPPADPAGGSRRSP